MAAAQLQCLPNTPARYHFRFKMRWGPDPAHVAWMDVTNEARLLAQLVLSAEILELRQKLQLSLEASLP